VFTLTFPRREMLLPEHYAEMQALIRRKAPKAEIQAAAHRIRLQLNPHPAGQRHNIPEIDGIPLGGVQHKYRETLLFFPSQGQTCHAYCTFCFRWPQFVGMNELKFAMRETDLLIRYLQAHPELTDVLFTGGDPMIMKARVLAAYIEPLLADGMEQVQTLRIGTKALGYWPHTFLTDEDADETLRLFERIPAAGKNLAIMAHFNPLPSFRPMQCAKEKNCHIRPENPRANPRPMPETLKSCPQCQSPYGYAASGTQYACPECGHEWEPESQPAEPQGLVVKDANGTILQDGDSVIVIKTLPVKGFAHSIKPGTKVKGIRLVEGDHNIDCKVEGFGAMALKSEFVRKA
jgi:alkylphosphonate utilization operon protein PhnA